jgi:ribosomal protein S1
VQAIVLNIDKENQRFSLGIKQSSKPLGRYSSPLGQLAKGKSL